LALSGLPPGRPFCVAVHAAGDLRNGAASTGHPWPNAAAALLAAGVADAAGAAAVATPAAALRAWELVGRAAVIHSGSTPDDAGGARLAAAVLARSAAVGSNAKRVCACDGTVIWNADAFA
jgi:copper chaperone for superoxide dismutase